MRQRGSTHVGYIIFWLGSESPNLKFAKLKNMAFGRNRQISCPPNFPTLQYYGKQETQVVYHILSKIWQVFINYVLMSFAEIITVVSQKYAPPSDFAHYLEGRVRVRAIPEYSISLIKTPHGECLLNYHNSTHTATSWNFPWYMTDSVVVHQESYSKVVMNF